MRRAIDDLGALTAYIVFAPTGTTLAYLARVPESGCQVDISFAGAKDEVGLDEYEIRRWHGWYWHITLALVAHAVLAVMRAMGEDRGAVTQKVVPTARPQFVVAV